MAADNLQIVIVGTLDSKQTIRNLNAALKTLENNPALQQLPLPLKLPSATSDLASKLGDSLQSSASDSAIEELKSGLENVGGALAKGATGARVFGIALSAASKAILPLAIITTVTSGISFLFNQYEKHKQAQEALRQQNEQIAQSWSSQKENIQSLVLQYRELDAATSHGSVFADAEQEKQYRDTIEQLSQLMPNLVDSIDKKGDKHLKSAAAIQKELEYVEKLTRFEQKKDLGQADSTFKGLVKDLKGDHSEQAGYLMQQATGTVISGFTPIKLDDAGLEQVGLQVSKLEADIENDKDRIRHQLADYVNEALDLSGVKVDGSLVGKLTESLDFSKLKSGKDLSKKVDQYTELIQKMDQLYQAQGSSSAKSVEQQYLELARTFGISEDRARSLMGTFVELKDASAGVSSSVKDPIVEYNAASQQFQQNLDGGTASISLLSSAYETLQNGQSLSLDTLFGLIQKYPEYASLLVDSNATVKEKGALLEQIANMEREQRLEEAKRLLESNQETLNSLEAKRTMYLNFYRAMSGTLADDTLKSIGDQMFTPEEQEQYANAEKEQAKLNAQIALLEKPISFQTPPSAALQSSPPQPSRDYQDPTEAHIRAINLEAEAREKLNQLVQNRADQLKNEGSYNLAIEKTNVLLRSQQKETELLLAANAKLQNERKQLQGGTSYKMSSWTDESGEATEAYLKIYNQASPAAQQSLQKLLEKWQSYTKAIQQNKDSLVSLNGTMAQTQANLDDLRLQNTQTYLTKLSKDYEQVQSQIHYSEDVQSLLGAGTPEYEAELNRQIGLHRQLQQELETDNNWIKLRLRQNEKASASEKLTADQVALLNKQLADNESAWYDSARAIQSADKSLNESRAQAYSQLKDRELQLIQNQIDLEDQRHEQTMRHLSDEMDRYSESVSLIKESLSRENETTDYEANLAKLQGEAQNILNLRNQYALDRSVEGNARKAELDKQYEDKQDEIDRLRTDRQRQLREQGLDDLLKQKQREIDASQDAETAEYNANKEKLDKMKSDIDTFWTNTLAGEDLYLQDQSQIIDDHLTQVQASLQNFFTGTSNISRAIGSSLKQGITDSVNDWTVGSRGSTAPSATTPPGTDSSGSGSLGSAEKVGVWQTYLNNKREAEALAQQNNKGARFNELHQINDSLRDTWHFPDGSYEELKNLTVYHDGGEVGVSGTTTRKWWEQLVRSDEVPAILRKGEVVLDRPIQFLGSVSNQLFSHLAMAQSAATTPPGAVNYHFQVNIEKVTGGQEGADTFFSAIKRTIQTRQIK